MRSLGRKIVWLGLSAIVLFFVLISFCSCSYDDIDGLFITAQNQKRLAKYENDFKIANPLFIEREMLRGERAALKAQLRFMHEILKKEGKE